MILDWHNCSFRFRPPGGSTLSDLDLTDTVVEVVSQLVAGVTGARVAAKRVDAD